MIKQEPIPYAHHGISGGISIKLRNNTTVDDFCISYIPDYNADRFEAIAIRIFSGKEFIVTIYALDKYRQEGNTYKPNKIPVKKFKILTLSTAQVFQLFEEFNFTVSTGNYTITDMEIINK